MGARGRQPQSSAQLKLVGSHRAADRKKEELAVVAGSPQPPAWLSASAQEEWGRILPPLLALGIVTPQDRAALAIHCHAWGELEQAIKDVAELEAGKKVFAGHMIDHPRVVMGRAFERLMKTADRFGLSSAARARLGGAQQNGNGSEPNPKARFFPHGPATRAG